MLRFVIVGLCHIWFVTLFFLHERDTSASSVQVLVVAGGFIHTDLNPSCIAHFRI